TKERAPRLPRREGELIWPLRSPPFAAVCGRATSPVGARSPDRAPRLTEGLPVLQRRPSVRPVGRGLETPPQQAHGTDGGASAAPASPRRRSNMAIKIATICGSVRPGNYTSKALRLALDEFAKHTDVEVTSFFLDKIDLPLPGQPAKDSAAVERFRQTIKE